MKKDQIEGKKLIVFPARDFKYREWSRELNKLGLDTYADARPFVFSPFSLVALLLGGRNVSAYVFRYLNDKPPFLKSILKAVCDALVVLICKLAKIRIYWFLHNVDKESKVYYPAITKFRRGLLKSAASKIWVMDSLLIEHAVRQGFDGKRLDQLCFGRPTFKKPNTETEALKEDIISFKAKMRRKYPSGKVDIGLCVSSPLPKFFHFLHASSFVEKASSDDSMVCLVIYGKIPDHPAFSHLADIYKANDKILHINRNFEIDESALREHIDFIYRSVDDLSVSYSVYVAASIGKPVITDDIGFLPEMITKYGLGLVVPLEYRDVNSSVLDLLAHWDGTNSRHFLETHTWDIAAKRLSDEVREGSCA